MFKLMILNPMFMLEHSAVLLIRIHVLHPKEYTRDGADSMMITSSGQYNLDKYHHLSIQFKPLPILLNFVIQYGIIKKVSVQSLEIDL